MYLSSAIINSVLSVAKEHRRGALLLFPNLPGHTSLATAVSKDRNSTPQKPTDEAIKQAGSERYF